MKVNCHASPQICIITVFWVSIQAWHSGILCRVFHMIAKQVTSGLASHLWGWQGQLLLCHTCDCCICTLVAQSYLTPPNSMDHSLPGSVHGILQARILDWVAIPFSRGSSRPTDGTLIYCNGRQILYCLSHHGGLPSVLCDFKVNESFLISSKERERETRKSPLARQNLT